MNIAVDLHAHSPYAGASGKVNFERLQYVMGIKGIDVYGSGDILFEKWLNELDSAFKFDNKSNMWQLPGNLYLMPQTEIIVTLPYPLDEKKRKLFHLVILFSNKNDIKQLRKLLLAKEAKLTIGRPFVKFSSAIEMQEFLCEIKNKLNVAFVPAHVMTPEGIFGGKNPVDSLDIIFGDSISVIDAFESGLSADPEMLAPISAQYNIPIISSSDAHSAAFNKLGREFSQLNVDDISTEGIINSIKNRKIIKTVEFPPEEGRYYLTGHRGDRQGHNGKEIVYENKRPNECPICGKDFIPGVKERIATISKQKGISQDFVYQIPLVEIISRILGVGVNTKKVTNYYLDVLKNVGRESNIWLESINDELKNKIPDEMLRAIQNIKNNNFRIVPGFDGNYGRIEF